jgi:hypothetical protein
LDLGSAITLMAALWVTVNSSGVSWLLFLVLVKVHNLVSL